VKIAETVDKVLDSLAPGARSYDRYGIALDADTAPAQLDWFRRLFFDDTENAQGT
jgi:hypothetical protein